MSEVALLPGTNLTLTTYAPLVHVEPHISLLPETTLTLTPNSPKAITPSSWPATLPQYFLDDGNYGEQPYPVVLETPTDSGIRKTRKSYTGKFTIYTGTIWLAGQTEYDIFMNFYNNDADQGTAVFTIPVPSASGAKAVKFLPGSLSIVSDGGIGWHATFQLIQEPEAL